MTKKKDKPEPDKIYSLTGAPGVKCIANGNSWKESEFHENLKEDPLLLAEQRMLLNEEMDNT